MSCFYFCFFLLIFVFKVLGSATGFLVAHGQARHGLMQLLSLTDAEILEDVAEDFIGGDFADD